MVHIAFFNENNHYFHKVLDVLVIFAEAFAKLFADVCEKCLPRRAAHLDRFPPIRKVAAEALGRIVKAWMNSVLFHWMPIRNWRFACSLTYKCPGVVWGLGRICFFSLRWVWSCANDWAYRCVYRFLLCLCVYVLCNLYFHIGQNSTHNVCGSWSSFTRLGYQSDLSW